MKHETRAVILLHVLYKEKEQNKTKRHSAALVKKEPTANAKSHSVTKDHRCILSFVRLFCQTQKRHPVVWLGSAEPPPTFDFARKAAELKVTDQLSSCADSASSLLALQ